MTLLASFLAAVADKSAVRAAMLAAKQVVERRRDAGAASPDETVASVAASAALAIASRQASDQADLLQSNLAAVRSFFFFGR
jgi:hypothetical protein